MRRRSRSEPEIPYPSHWSGPPQVLALTTRAGEHGTAQLAAPRKSRLPTVKMAYQGSRGLAPMWAPIAHQRIHHAQELRLGLSQRAALYEAPAGAGTGWRLSAYNSAAEDEAFRRRQWRAARRTDSIAKLAAQHDETRASGLERREFYFVQQARAAERSARTRIMAEEPRNESVTFLPRLPQPAMVARRTWAADAAPPHSPHEAEETVRRVEALSTYSASEVVDVFRQATSASDRMLLERLRAKVGLQRGMAPQPWHFRNVLGTPVADTATVGGLGDEVDDEEQREGDAKAARELIKTMWG